MPLYHTSIILLDCNEKANEPLKSFFGISISRDTTLFRPFTISINVAHPYILHEQG